MDWHPDIVVAIDFGTTFTGVGWLTTRPPLRPEKVVNDWPGSYDQGERKVPSLLKYDGNGNVSSWGFLCEDDNDGDQVRREYFKMFLNCEDDEARFMLTVTRDHGIASAPKDADEARKFATDYLRELYSHIRETVERGLGRRTPAGWLDMAVEFVFSVPTTWTSPKAVQRFRAIVHDAGFGAEPGHRMVVGLTEAEAAAIATVKTSNIVFKAGDVFLSIDAGGGTTDLALMRVVKEFPPAMEQIDAVRGVGIGSMLIDKALMQLVASRLDKYPEAKIKLPPETALRIAQSHHWKVSKHKFGQEAYRQPMYRIPLDGASHDFSHDGIGMEGGRMIFSREEFQQLFDIQINKILRLVRGQLDFLEGKNYEPVRYIILSGGLGSSSYLREKMEQQFSVLPHTQAQNVTIVTSEDARLVVVKGLLLDRRQQLGASRSSILMSRIARASYGVLTMTKFIPDLHHNEEVMVDQYDKSTRWVRDQVEWLIKKGDKIDPNVPFSKKFERKLAPDEATRSWDVTILLSHNAPKDLPSSLNQDGVIKLCDVTSNLSGVRQKQLLAKRGKRKHIFLKGKKYYVLEFDIKVIVGPADLQFELWFEGKKFSANHEPIKVKWDTELEQTVIPSEVEWMLSNTGKQQAVELE